MNGKINWRDKKPSRNLRIALFMAVAVLIAVVMWRIGVFSVKTVIKPAHQVSGTVTTASPVASAAPPVAVAASAPVKNMTSSIPVKMPKKVTPVTPTVASLAVAPAPAVSAASEAPAFAAVPIQASSPKVVLGKLFRWTKVGGDPCNPKAGCTLEWALGKTGWPSDVQQGLIAVVKGSSPTTISITSGLGGSKGPTWTGWMTWGKYQPKFEMNTVAAWPSGQYEPASLWTYESGSTKYNLIKVRKCGNWGGWTEVLQKPAPVLSTAPQLVLETGPEPMNLGVLPIVACIEE